MVSKSRIGVPSRISAKGEGAFLSFLAEYAILHKVCTSDDMGIDYFGEWLNKATNKSLESSNVLFAIQLKTSDKDNVEATFVGKDERLNLLDQYELKRVSKDVKRKYDDIKPATIGYWKGLEIPVYLFVVVTSNTGHDMYYKRFTPILHGTIKRHDEKFYKANKRTSFLAFATPNNAGGFCRDLFIDYIRCNYRKGSIAYKNPRDLGLNQFPENLKTVFIDMVKKEYKDEIRNAFDRLSELGLFDESAFSPSSPGGGPSIVPDSDDTAIPSLAPDGTQ